MNRTLRNLLYIGIILLLVGAADRWLNSGPSEEAVVLPVLPAQVESVVVRRGTLRPEYRFQGELQPSRRVELRFEVSGQVLRGELEAGQEVAQGQVLLAMEDLDYRDTVTAARARLRREREALARDRELLELARAEVGLLEKEQRRLDDLGRRSLAPASQVDEARLRLLRQRAEQARLSHSVSGADASLQSLQAELRRAERALSRTRLRAPFSGVVNRVPAKEGEYIGPGQAAVELLRLDPLELRLWVPGEVSAALQNGRQVEVRGPDGTRFTAEVRGLQAASDPLTHTHELQLRVPAAPELRPGLIATALLPGRPLENVLLLPAGAVLRDTERAYVFRIEQQQLRRVPVQLLLEHDGWIALSGLEAGARVAFGDVAALSDGRRVRARPPSGPAPPR